MLKLRPAKERYLGITEADACEVLGITPDQLRIARALDRDWCKWFHRLMRHSDFADDHDQYWSRQWKALENHVPTFDTEDKPCPDHHFRAMDFCPHCGEENKPK